MKKTLLLLVALLGMATASPAQVTFTYTSGHGNDNRDNEGMDKMFDGNLNTKYCGNTGDDTYAIVSASEPVYVWGYELTTANDNVGNNNGRLVKRWTVCGTNDENVANDPNAEGWVTLSGFGKNDFMQEKNFNTQRFFCDKATVGSAYKYFKVVLNEGGFVQLSKFEFCYELQPVVTYNWHSSSDGNSKKAVDWLVGQKWEGSNLAGNWVTIETSDGQPHSVKSYAFTTHDDGSWHDRAPKTWKIEGSNDNESWITIHEVTEGNPIQNENYKTFDFIPTDNESAFRYLKLTLNSMKSTGWTQVGEFHVEAYYYIAETCPGHTIVPNVTVQPTCFEDGYEKGTCLLCGKSVVQPIAARGYHTYGEDGLCTDCQAPQENYMTAMNGYYQPTTVTEFTWLAAMIQYGHAANIKLVQDVDLTGFAGFGNGDDVVPFKGELDGQGHWLKNLRIDVAMKNVGLFGKTDGANIHDLGLDNAYVKTAWGFANAGGIVGSANNTIINRVAVLKDSYVEGYDHVGAIVGNTEGSTVVSNCMADITVLSGAYQAGGLVGTSNGLTLENCLFTGEVRNNNFNSAGLVALLDSEKAPTTLRNNISAASQVWVGRGDGVYSLVNTGGRSATYVNNRVAASMQFAKSHWDDDNRDEESYTENFTVANDWNGLSTPDDDMKVKSFYTEAMGWDMENDWAFVEAGKYPVPAWMAQQVTVTEYGYATMVAKADALIPEGVLAFAAKKNDETGRYTLIPVEKAIPAGSAIIIKAAPGTYAFLYENGSAEQIAENDLVAAMDDVTTDGTQYVLANGEQGIGFYKATGTIAAGKGYIISNNAAVKAFLPGKDNTTGINAVQANEEETIYNVAGQRIQKMQKGINIMGGKKVLK